jgi:hypothetical protein
MLTIQLKQRYKPVPASETTLDMPRADTGAQDDRQRFGEHRRA